MISIQNTHLFQLLKEQAGGQGKKYIYLALLSGLMQGLTVFAILHALQALAQDGKIGFHMMLFYIVCLFAFYQSFRYVMNQVSLMALTGIAQWRIRIAVKVRAVDMRSFEQISLSQLQSVLLDSREVTIEASRMLVIATSSVVMMLVSMVKMFSISVFGGCFVVVLMMIGGLRLVRSRNSLNSMKSEAVAYEMRFITSLRNIIGGFAELKMNRDKTTELFTEVIEPDAAKSLEYNSQIESVYSHGLSFFEMLNYLVLGIALFFLPGFAGMQPEEVGQLMVVAMFCLSPLVGLVIFIPLLSKTEFSLKELVDLEELVDSAAEKSEQSGVAENWRYRTVAVPSFESVRIENLCFQYRSKAGSPQFEINIGQFQLSKGEIVLVRGGNGSGKSTLMKVIAGLYTEYDGKLLFNERAVTENNIESYRNVFSSVFSDFHLFDQPLGIPKTNLKKIDELLERMELLDKVSITDGDRFTTNDLSAGQKKRLALVCAMLEGRDVYLFDEIAADFDPEFRDFFYRVLLKELQEAGATVLAISHDDRYFDVADRVIAMDKGVIVNGNGSLFSKE
jgi:putative ATP-binding cassette transporter